MKVSKKNGSKVAINSRIKAISSKRLISEIKQRLDDNIISRREVLELAGIGYCLDCSKGWGNIEKNGFCVSCNEEWKEAEKKEVKKSKKNFDKELVFDCV